MLISLSDVFGVPSWLGSSGLELAARPTVLYLDEPTSGLDSTSSLQVINSLSLSAKMKT